jgi:hypothetical protein
MERVKALAGEIATWFLVVVLGAAFVLGAVLPADVVDSHIIDWKADAVQYFSSTQLD